MQHVAPETVGFSATRLGRVELVMRRLVDQGTMAGAVTLIARQGSIVHVRSHGMLDRESGTPMPPDAIFRVYSMTKPVTAVATLALFEEGHFLLDDPVSDFIPAFARTRVFAGETAQGIDAGALERPITIRHLLMHTSGLPYGNPNGTRCSGSTRGKKSLGRTRPSKYGWTESPSFRSPTSRAPPGPMVSRTTCWVV
ncbi:MAG: serine hydrolase domain-containing protein [Chloroflexota bacterium]